VWHSLRRLEQRRVGGVNVDIDDDDDDDHDDHDDDDDDGDIDDDDDIDDAKREGVRARTRTSSNRRANAMWSTHALKPMSSASTRGGGGGSVRAALSQVKRMIATLCDDESRCR
jgi:hypothetical protein